MKKKIMLCMMVLFASVSISFGYVRSSDEVLMTDIQLSNVEAITRSEYMGGGTCWGTGAGGSNVTCYGGYKICAWCHENVYGKN